MNVFLRSGKLSCHDQLTDPEKKIVRAKVVE